MKAIRYAIDTDNLTYGIYDNDYSIIEFDFGEISSDNVYVDSLYRLNPYIVHFTRLLPINIKNAHRAFWGMKPLSVEKIVPRWFLDYGSESTINDASYTAPKEALKIVLGMYASCESKCRQPQIERLFGDVTFDQVIVFDLPSNDIDILREKLSFYDTTKHLEIKPCTWKTYGW